MGIPRILWRYVFLDVLTHAVLGLAAITLLIVVGNILRFLEGVVGAGVSLSVLGQLMLAILPSFLCYAVPTALVFGILITLGRMSADGELVALRGSGISVAQLLPPVLALGVVAALVTAYLMAEIGPRSFSRMKQIARELSAPTALLAPGKLREFGDSVLFFQSAGGPGCPMRGVVIADFSGADENYFVTGTCGEVLTEDAGSRLVFRLNAGSIHLAATSDQHYRLIRFDDMELPLDVPPQMLGRRWPKEYTTLELIEIESRAEKSPEWMQDLWIQLHQRVAFPMASIVLAIVAVPLGIRPLRTGRSAGALTAAILVGAYWVVSSTAEDAAESGRLSVMLALWLPNLLFLALGIHLMRRSTYLDP